MVTSFRRDKYTPLQLHTGLRDNYWPSNPWTNVVEWDLVCSRAWVAGYIRSLFIMGQILGSLLFGILIDRYGRKTPLAFAAVLQMTFSITGAAMPEVYSFLFVRFLVGVITSGQVLVALIIVTEIMGPRWRLFAVTLYFSSAHLGAILLCGTSSVLRHRLPLQLAFSMPLLLLLLHIRYVPESPRWLIISGHVTQGRKILLKMADTNESDLKEDINAQAVLTGDELMKYRYQWLWNSTASTVYNFCSPGQEEDSLRQPFVLCKSGILLSRLMWNSYLWFVLGVLAQRLTLDTQHVLSDERALVALFGVTDLIGLGLTPLVSSRFGRRGTLATIFVIVGVLLQCLAPIPKELAGCGIGVLLACRFLVTCAAFLYTMNFLGCFPTNSRGFSLGFGFSVYSAGCLVATTLPHLALVHPALGYVLLGGLLVLGSLIVVFLPDTESSGLPDVTEEAEEIPGRFAACLAAQPAHNIPRCYNRGLTVRPPSVRRSTLLVPTMAEADGAYVWDEIIRSASL